MSFMCLICFIAGMSGVMPKEYLTDNFFIVWALFSIGDAIWAGRCKK